MIKALILSLLLSVTVGAKAFADSDLKKLKNSIFKIAVYMPEGPAVATAFVVSSNNEKFIITNNHVCDGFYKAKKVVLIPSQTLISLPRNKAEVEKLDEITDYYMHPGSDICIAKSKQLDKYDALYLSSDGVEPTDDILIAGFVGRSMDLMYVQGKVYGTIPVDHPLELRNCLFNPPPPQSSGSVTCNFFNEYPVYVRKTLQTAVNNIGPGFSGSPVLRNSKVAGIVCRYFVPASGYSNGDVIFFPVSDLKDALSKASKSMVKADSTQYIKMIKISEFDQELKQYFQETEEDLQDFIRSLLKRANE